jgi:hypothetical protein
MSTHTSGQPDDDPDLPPPSSFTGSERYWRAAEAWFDRRLTREQREICETVAENQYTLVEGANGFGKTYSIVVLALSFFRRHYPSSVVVTSGTYGKLKRTFCADAEALHKDSKEKGLFGEWKWSPTPHIDIEGEPTWQFEIHSPEDPEELEGVHNDYTLVIVDEADKKGVDDKLIDSMDSLISDRNDRMVVLCNPPRDETNVVHDLREEYDAYRNYSTFDSHNVRVERGAATAAEQDVGMVGGLTGLSKLKKNWQKYNHEDWPGFEAARKAHREESEHYREDLDDRWYRRHAGIMPPAGARVKRPFYLEGVKEAFGRPFPETGGVAPDGLALDVARKGGDANVLFGFFRVDADGDRPRPVLRVLDDWRGQDHVEGEANVRSALGDGWNARFPVDADGEGSALADNIGQFYPALERFSNGENAVGSGAYKDKWSEALHHFGEFLAAGGSFNHRKLREEALAAARVIEYEERFYQSRDAEVYKANSKDDIKEVLGRSPDYLDAAIMACWAAADATIQSAGITRSTRQGASTATGSRKRSRDGGSVSRRTR